MQETKSDFIRKYHQANPLLQAKALLELMAADLPEMFKVCERDRNTVKSILHRIRPRVLTPLNESRINANPFNLPEAYDLEWLPYELTGVSKVLCLSDIHLPYHDIKAITLALDYGKKHEADCILLNGDILDIYQGSRFIKDPRKPSINEEIKAGIALFSALRKTFPKAQIIYKLGNHDERFEHFLFEHPQILELEGFTLPDLLRCDNFGVDVIEDARIIRAGKLPIYHGHEFGGGGVGGVNPARALFLKLFTLGICGHFHRTSSHTEKLGDGSMITTFSTGCLCQMTPEYSRVNKWNHGFSFIEIDGHEFELSNLRIYQGRIFK